MPSYISLKFTCLLMIFAGIVYSYNLLCLVCSLDVDDSMDVCVFGNTY